MAADKAAAMDWDEELQKERKDKAKELKGLALSACATTVFLLVYCVIGAWTIAAIEGPLEQPRRTKQQLAEDLIASLLQLTAKPVCQVALNASLGDKDDNDCVHTAALQVLVTDYQSVALANVVKSGVTVDHQIWTLLSSTFYCWSLAVTVGYGKFCPTSVPGKIFTMLYSLFGIPLLILNATKLGSLFTICLSRLKVKIVCACAHQVNSMRRTILLRQTSSRRSRRQGDVALLLDNPKVRISKLNQRLTRLVKERNRRAFLNITESLMPFWIAAIIFPLYIAFVGSYFYIFESLSFFDCFYFAFITFTSIGFGDIVPDKELEFMLFSLFIFLGVGFCASVVECMELRMLRWSKDIKLYVIDEFGPEGNKKTK